MKEVEFRGELPSSPCPDPASARADPLHKIAAPRLPPLGDDEEVDLLIDEELLNELAPPIEHDQPAEDAPSDDAESPPKPVKRRHRRRARSLKPARNWERV